MDQYYWSNSLAQCWPTKIRITLQIMFLCKVVHGICVNIAQVTFLCNAGTCRLRQHCICSFPAKACLYALGQHPSRHSDVLTTLWQRRCWRCHVVARSKMRAVPTSVSDVLTTLLSGVIKTLPQRCCKVAKKLSIGFLGYLTTDYSDFFPFIETRESYKSAKWY